MGKVVMHNVVSVDGFIADDNDGIGPLFEWYGNGEHALEGGGAREGSRRPPTTTCCRSTTRSR